MNPGQHLASDAIVNAYTGKSIASGCSSLNRFAVTFSDGSVLLLEGLDRAGELVICLSPVDASDLPNLSEAVCAVDWNWIVGSKVRSIVREGSSIRFILDPAGPLTVAVAKWQGAPFLSFQPYKR